MKKLLTITAAALMGISASAQSEAGSFTLQPNVGFTYTTATGDFGEGADGGFALTAGVEGMYMVNEKFGAALGLNFTGHNVSRNVFIGNYSVGGYPKNEDVIYSNYYFNIPITANYYVMPGLALKAGIAMNILSTAKIDGKDKVLGENVKDMYKSTFFSVPVGASYEYKSFVFDARYNIYLTKALKDSDSRHSVFNFTLGYKFAL